MYHKITKMSFYSNEQSSIFLLIRKTIAFKVKIFLSPPNFIPNIAFSINHNVDIWLTLKWKVSLPFVM